MCVVIWPGRLSLCRTTSTHTHTELNVLGAACAGDLREVAKCSLTLNACTGFRFWPRNVHHSHSTHHTHTHR